MLEKIANIATIVGVVVTVALLGYRMWPTGPAPAPDAYKVGERFNTRLPVHSKALVMVTGSKCHFCVESLPFYRDVARTARERGYAVIAVSADSDLATHRAFLGSHSVAFDEAVLYSESGLQVRGTPTTVVVRADGMVQGVWTGRLSAGTTSEIVAALAR